MTEEIKYAVLQEVNDTEVETWLYFIKHNGNETNLQHLQKQLESVDWYMLDDLSTFDLDLEHLVSTTTAKEMTKVELNAYQWHRKFDGTLKEIDLGFKKKDSDKTKMSKTFDILGYGQIENFIGDEDIDEEDLATSAEESVSSDDSKDYDLEETHVPKSLRRK